MFAPLAGGCRQPNLSPARSRARRGSDGLDVLVCGPQAGRCVDEPGERVDDRLVLRAAAAEALPGEVVVVDEGHADPVEVDENLLELLPRDRPHLPESHAVVEEAAEPL